MAVGTQVRTYRDNGAEMEPLSSEDLVVRQQPIDEEQWLTGEDNTSDVGKRTIPLERFQTLERVIRDSPITVDPYLELARIYLHQNRYNDAKRILDLATEKFPEEEQANFLREEAQINRGLQLLEESQKEHDAEPTKLTLEALERSKVEVNVLREKICRARLVRHPEKLELNLPLASALENLGNPADAIQCLQHAIRRPQLRAKASLQLAQLLERAKRVPEALSAYRKAALYNVPPPPEDVKYTAIFSAANLAEQYGLVDSAIRYLELLSEMQPNNQELAKRLEALRKAEL
ncbi:MAG: tetratricopeptide repeat protein [Planctomycetota bacterium]